MGSLGRPCLISLVAIARIASTSTRIFTIVSVIAAVGDTSVYDSSLLKKLSMRPKISARASCLALTSLAAYKC